MRYDSPYGVLVYTHHPIQMCDPGILNCPYRRKSHPRQARVAHELRLSHRPNWESNPNLAAARNVNTSPFISWKLYRPSTDSARRNRPFRISLTKRYLTGLTHQAQRSVKLPPHTNMPTDTCSLSEFHTAFNLWICAFTKLPAPRARVEMITTTT